MMDDYCPGLKMIWNNRLECWQFYHDEQNFGTYYHEDGVKALEVDGNSAEIMRIVRRSNSYVNYDNNIRELNKAHEKRQERHDRDELRTEQETSEENQKVSNHFEKGPKIISLPKAS